LPNGFPKRHAAWLCRTVYRKVDGTVGHTICRQACRRSSIVRLQSLSIGSPETCRTARRADRFFRFAELIFRESELSSGIEVRETSRTLSRGSLPKTRFVTGRSRPLTPARDGRFHLGGADRSSLALDATALAPFSHRSSWRRHLGGPSGLPWKRRCSRSPHTGEHRKKDLEGEQSPWKDRPTRCWQRLRGGTDSPVEQSPEGDCSPWDRQQQFPQRICLAVYAATRRWHRSRACQLSFRHFGVVSGVRGGPLRWIGAPVWLARFLAVLASRTFGRNIMMATAAVTQYGYRRGGFFEGCETRREEGEGRFNSSGAVDASSPKRGEPQDWQRDATSPRPSNGENRRGGAKPRGRNLLVAGTDKP
jgi:hypothetical protein